MLSEVDLELPLTPSGTVHEGRKAWLKSDRRKKMEAVAVAQGWIQYTDPKTRSKFWHCHLTNESYHELVFVGETNVYLNRWCSSDGTKDGAKKAPTPNSLQPADHNPTPEETARRHDSRTRSVDENALASDALSFGSNAVQTAEGRDDESTINADDESAEGENNRRSKRKPRHKPVKGRHTRGKSPSSIQQQQQQQQQQPVASNSNSKVDGEGISRNIEDINDSDKSGGDGSNSRQPMGDRFGDSSGPAADISTEAMTQERNNKAIEAAVNFAEEEAIRSSKDPLSDDTNFIARESPVVRSHLPLPLNSPPRPTSATVQKSPRNNNSTKPIDVAKRLRTPEQSDNKAVKGPPLQRTSRLVFFMHLHKAAGTTLCELAVKNGHRSPGMRQDVKDARGKKVTLLLLSCANPLSRISYYLLFFGFFCAVYSWASIAISWAMTRGTSGLELRTKNQPSGKQKGK